jgi:hypothetical protein
MVAGPQSEEVDNIMTVEGGLGFKDWEYLHLPDGKVQGGDLLLFEV